MKKIIFASFFIIAATAGQTAFGQSKIKDGSMTSSPLAVSNAILELESNNKGLLLPRVALTATTAYTPLTAHVAGMTVYNTATVADVTPGYYFNDGTKWIRIADATKGDLTKDAWIDNSADSTVRLGTKSDGVTVRSTGNNVVIKDDGSIGIRTETPSATLEVNGTVEIQDVAYVPDTVQYKRLAWNTQTQRVETAPDEGNVRKFITNVEPGDSVAVYTLFVNGNGGYDIRVQVIDACGAGSYNKFIATGANQNSRWRMNFLGGISAAGVPTATLGGSPVNTRITMQNPGSICNNGVGGSATSLNYTIGINPATGTVFIKNNGDVARDYTIIFEKAFN